jgi:carboxymethylenebutenolidase
MQRMKASDFPKEVMSLFDRYVHGGIDRREFLDKASKYAVGGMTAAAMLEALRPNFVLGEQIKPTDARIKAEEATVQSPQGTGTVKGYFVRPAKASGKLPAIVVIHENRGLNPHIRDIARRLAVANFVVFAPDALTPLGGYPMNEPADKQEEVAAQMFNKLDQAKRTEDLTAGAQWIKNHAESTGKLGAVGFCFGGGEVNKLAVRLGDGLNAGVPFYGAQPPAADVAKIKAHMLIQYAEMDDRIDAGWPAYEAALKANKVHYEQYTYPGTMHGFNNDTTPRYSEAQAKIAWERTEAWFNKYVRSSS